MDCLLGVEELCQSGQRPGGEGLGGGCASSLCPVSPLRLGGVKAASRQPRSVLFGLQMGMLKEHCFHVGVRNTVSLAMNASSLTCRPE